MKRIDLGSVRFPHEGSWSDKVLEYLQEYGESRATEIRSRIGLDKYCKKTARNSPYRSNIYLLSIVMPRLIKARWVKKLDKGLYTLCRPYFRPIYEIPIDREISAFLISNIHWNKTQRKWISLASYKGSLVCMEYWEKGGKKGWKLYMTSFVPWYVEFYGEEYLRKWARKYGLKFHDPNLQYKPGRK